MMKKILELENEIALVKNMSNEDKVKYALDNNIERYSNGEYEDYQVECDISDLTRDINLFKEIGNFDTIKNNYQDYSFQFDVDGEDIDKEKSLDNLIFTYLDMLLDKYLVTEYMVESE